MFEWDGVACDFPNRVLIQLWDERSQQHSQARGNSNIVPEGFHAHVFIAPTLEALTAETERRLARLRELTGGLELAPDFDRAARATIARWNEMAAEGVDRDFHRGETVVEVEGFGGPVADERAGATARCGRSRTRGRTTPRSSPAERSTRRAARR